MNQHDDDLQDFFADMRKRDEQVSIPEYETLTRRKTRWRTMGMVSLGMAAALVIAFTFYFNTEKKPVNQVDMAWVITLSPNGGTTTQSLISNESDIDTWEAPSDFLIDDFQ